MKHAWKIGRIAGITVRVHVTFLLLVVWIAWAQFAPRQSLVDVARGLGLIAVVFAVVVLHELGHALTARRFHIRTRDITLLPIGGVARLERMPEAPREEMLVALAGPAVNAVLALAAFPLAAWLHSPGVTEFAWINVTLGAFNLLPAFPMDGGRVLRAMLATRMDRAGATQIAARVGQVFAFLLAFAGLVYNPILLLIAAFVWLGGLAEAKEARMQAALSGVTVGAVMATEFHALTPADTLAHAAELSLGARQTDFPVVVDGELAGFLHREDLLAGLSRFGDQGLVAAAMRRTTACASVGEKVEHFLKRAAHDQPPETYPVVDQGRVVGLLTPDNIAERIMIDAALRHPTPAP